MIPKRQQTDRPVPASGPKQPKQEVLLENNNLRLSERDSKTFLTDDGSPPNAALIAAAKRNKDLFK